MSSIKHPTRLNLYENASKNFYEVDSLDVFNDLNELYGRDFLFFKSGTFTQSVSQCYSNGSLQLDMINRLCQRALEEAKNKGKENSEQAFSFLLCCRELCVLAIQAKKDYYQNTVWGKIASFFNSFIQLLGGKTSIEVAEDTIEAMNQCFNTNLEQSHQPIKETAEKHFEQMMQNFLPTIISIIGDQDNPISILFHKPNGETYILKREKTCKIGQGSGRCVYRGVLLSQGKETEIAISTSMPQAGLEDSSAQIERNTQKMKEEEKQLRNFQTDGFIKIHDHFTVKINEVEIGFSMMDYFPNGDLSTFLQSKRLSQEQKEELTHSLINNVKKIHEENKIHRDIKEKNILIQFDSGTIKPILIDFESCIDSSDEERKKEISSTPQYWPPEYLSAYLQAEEKFKSQPQHLSEEEFIGLNISSSTTEKMDIWSLGLVLYRIWYGQDLIQAIDSGFTSQPPQMQTKTLRRIYSQQDQINSAFTNTNGKVPETIRKRIQGMLQVDPTQRSLEAAKEQPEIV